MRWMLSGTDVTTYFSEAEDSLKSAVNVINSAMIGRVNEARALVEKLNLLRPYQVKGVADLVRRKRCNLFDEMGLGKTPQVLVALQLLPSGPNDGRNYIVVCPNYAVEVWCQEIRKWWVINNTKCYIYTGPKKQRQQAADALQESFSGTRFVITSYLHLPELMRLFVGGKWEGLILDEAHAITNRKSKAFRGAQLASRRADVLFNVTGTPTRKNSSEHWNYLNLIDRGLYGSYWKFVESNFTTTYNGFGHEISGFRNVDGFRINHISPNTTRRLKQDVLKELPEKTRQLVLVELSPELQRAYNELAKSLMTVIEETPIVSATVLSNIAKLRQLILAPKTLGLKNTGSEVVSAACMLASSVEGKVVLFTPFRGTVRELQEYFALEGVKGRKTFIMTGEYDREKNTETLQAFKDYNGGAALIATVQMGASWAATEASTVIFCGYSWSPIHNSQAEDRVHRFGQSKAVTCYYVGAKGTIDQHILDVLEEKTNWSKLTLDPQNMLLPTGIENL